jgi:hypothetical protein
MPELQYSIVKTEDDTFITVFIPGEQPLPANSTHPNFDAIVAGAMADDSGIVDLFDVSKTVATRFERLSDRVTVAHGRVYFDGDEVDNSLTTQIVRFMDENVEDWQPLVNFFENVQNNPIQHSREQLYDWLSARDFTITPEGNIVGYKGVHRQGDKLVSGWSGSAIVDGEKVTGKIPNEVGSIVEMPRSEVAHDPSTACSFGLHVGTFSYAKGYARGAMLEVHVNPRDVVSVPTDGGGEKVRVCRYTVVDVIDAPHTSAVIYDDYDEEYDEDECECGDPDCDW